MAGYYSARVSRCAHVGRLLQLTSLASDVVAQILDGDEPEGISLRRLQQVLPMTWLDQKGNAPSFAAAAPDAFFYEVVLPVHNSLRNESREIDFHRLKSACTCLYRAGILTRFMQLAA